jgi:hypothetical protein
VGIALALLFYLVLRGGLIVPSLPSGEAGTGTPSIDATHLLNPYGIAAVSALAGMFSKQAIDKLREVFDTLFRTREPVSRTDPLAQTVPQISGVEPSKLAVGNVRELTVFGRGFQPNCVAFINGKSRQSKFMSDSHLEVSVVADDVTAEGELHLVIQNPDPNGGKSDPFVISIERA